MEQYKSLTFEKGIMEDDIGYDSYSTFYEVIEGKVKEKKIKNILNWSNVEHFDLVKLTPLTNKSLIKIIKKGYGSIKVYECILINLSKNSEGNFSVVFKE